MIYVARNPKDACVSWYYHQKLSEDFQADFAEMAKQYKAGLMTFTPILPHIIEAWSHRHNPNLYFTTYEKMKQDLATIVQEVAQFMGKDLTAAQLEAILKTVDIESFRKNK